MDATGQKDITDISTARSPKYRNEASLYEYEAGQKMQLHLTKELKRIMLERKIRQVDLVKLASLDAQLVSKGLNFKTSISVKMLLRTLDKLGYEVLATVVKKCEETT